MRYKNVNLVTRTQKWMGLVGCFGQIENIKRQSLVMLLKFSNMLLCMQFGVVNSYMSIQYPNYFCIPNILNILPNSEKVYPLSSAVAIDFSAFEIAS